MRSFRISAEEHNQPLVDILRRRLHLTYPLARRLVAERRVTLNGALVHDPAQRGKRAQRIEVHEGAPASPAPAALSPTLRHVDAHVVVVDKPAGLTTMRHPDEAAEFGARGKRFLPPTLADLLPPMLPRMRSGNAPPVFAVHRLDKDTSGLVVFARTKEAESHLGKQFRAHTIDRRYRAIVRGRAVSARIESWFVPDRGDGRRGSGSTPGQGKHAVTHVQVIDDLSDFTLVECRLETGRTHQVRIHLGEAGTPICGERVYDRPVHGTPVPDRSGAARLALHAARLGFTHPQTGRQVSWESSLPPDLDRLLHKLRQQAKN